MPCYCYETDDGAVYELWLPRMEPPEFIVRDGKTARRSFRAEGRGRRERLNAGHWPHVSASAGVAPAQIEEMKAEFPHHKFTPDGDMIFDNPEHMDRCLKDIGFPDQAPGRMP